MVDPDQYGEQEPQRRIEAAIRRAHKLPDKHIKELTGEGRQSPKRKAKSAKR